jgi:D-alanyl-lipoteichoic acid acyltransferase DltB (MBOAT superfamily)
MAGPIERATNLLPQISKPKTFDYALAVDGMRQILWGLFKKIVIADTAAIYVNQVFDTYQSQSGSTLLT